MRQKLFENLSLDPRQRRALLLACLALAVPVRARAAEPPQPAEQAEREVRALEAGRKEAIQAGGRAALERLYAPDFRGVTSGGAQVGQQDVVAGLLRAKGKAADSDDLQVRLLGNVALVTGRLRLADNGGTLRYLHVYVRRDGTWQIVAGQSTNVPEWSRSPEPAFLLLEEERSGLQAEWPLLEEIYLGVQAESLLSEERYLGLRAEWLLSRGEIPRPAGERLGWPCPAVLAEERREHSLGRFIVRRHENSLLTRVINRA